MLSAFRRTGQWWTGHLTSEAADSGGQVATSPGTLPSTPRIMSTTLRPICQWTVRLTKTGDFASEAKVSGG
ncbi:unnamed protein product [Larinioides sclopetarius]|uniref:Uncharacterized protein n=1 Tax=Larinioides sclopetarius TaxID=280406 RepID=A0AAV2AC23_9ARAC